MTDRLDEIETRLRAEIAAEIGRISDAHIPTDGGYAAGFIARTLAQDVAAGVVHIPEESTDE